MWFLVLSFYFSLSTCKILKNNSIIVCTREDKKKRSKRTRTLDYFVGFKHKHPLVTSILSIMIWFAFKEEFWDIQNFAPFYIVSYISKSFFDVPFFFIPQLNLFTVMNHLKMKPEDSILNVSPSLSPSSFVYFPTLWILAAILYQ